MLIEIKHILLNITPYLPFLGVAAVGADKTPMTQFISRMFEAAIIGGIIMYANIQVFDEKLSHSIEHVNTLQTSCTKNDLLIRELRENMILVREQLRAHNH